MLLLLLSSSLSYYHHQTVCWGHLHLCLIPLFLICISYYFHCQNDICQNLSYSNVTQKYYHVMEDNQYISHILVSICLHLSLRNSRILIHIIYLFRINNSRSYPDEREQETLDLVYEDITALLHNFITVFICLYIGVRSWWAFCVECVFSFFSYYKFLFICGILEASSREPSSNIIP